MFLNFYGKNMQTFPGNNPNQSKSAQIKKKQDAAHEPECSHVEHFCEQVIWTVLYIFPCYCTSAL